MPSRKLFVIVGILAVCLAGMSARAVAQELEGAFIFGSRNLSCEVSNAPGQRYSVVLHSSPASVAYDSQRGWGYEVLAPGNTSRGGYGQFGPFDDSPNGRAAFADNSCPTEIYDSFIGAKNFMAPCDEFIAGDRETPCSEAGLAPEGIIFRVDVPNGFYRFVGAFGSADNRHTSRILIENGGQGAPNMVTAEHIVLVNNFDQAEHCPGTFARVGFGCKLPPEGNGPQFIDMDEDGYNSEGGPESAVIEVTEGYIRMHQLQGNANGGACGARDPNGGNAVLLELWRVEDEVGGGEVGGATNVTRTIEAPSPVEPESEINVVLDVRGVDAPVSVVETFPESLEMIDDGGGQVEGNTITFNVEADGEVIYVVALPEGDCPFDTAEFSGSFEAENACGSTVRGEARVGCVQPPCEPDPEAPEAELVAAFVFGVHFDMCTSPNDEGFEYTIVRQEGPDSVAYDEARGWGYEVTAPGDASRAGYGQFGPFDDSPNDRNRFVGPCPEAVYDSFIGAKDFPSVCNAQTTGNPDVPCVEAGIPASGIVFRIDLPDNGLYRFVAAVGEADNPHAHTIVVEDGGEGPPSELGQNELALLVQNFDQNQQTTGQVKPDCLGCGVFARVGFDDKVPPMGDGIAPDPQFVNFDSDGLATANCPDSPFLEVTEGYIRLYQLQGNANLGPGSKSNGTVVDVNGGDMVLLEVWRVDDGGGPPPPPDEVCDNGIDDDEDGDTDCDDADCFDEESCQEPVGDLFRRGDADANGAMQLTDAVFVLLYLFSGGGEPPCMEASDADNNGALQLTDAVYVLLYLFSGGDAPPAPGPVDCGPDTGDADLGCGTYDNCGA